MAAQVILVAGFLAIRCASAILRQDILKATGRFCGWVLCACALWVFAGAAGAWFPIWPVVLAGFGGFLLSLLCNGTTLRISFDLVVFLLVCLLSNPPLSVGVQAGFAAFAIGIGFALDRFADGFSRTPRQQQVLRRWGIGGLCVLLFAGIWVGTKLRGRNSVDRAYRDIGTLPALAVSANAHLARVDLGGGSVAWLEQPAGGNPLAVAVFFHGNNSMGSLQKAAFAVRRSLLDSGYAVLSVDHPGYGESPNPAEPLEVESWNPLSSDLAAISAARRLTGCEDVIVVGHSMGCSDVLRTLGATREPVAGILLGAGLPDGSDRDEYWRMRFVRDRKLDQDLPLELVREIRSSFYDNGRLAQDLLPDHPTIYFVRFGIENGNLVETRDRLFALVPGSKRLLDLSGVGHYFNLLDIHGVMIGDSRTTAAFSSLLDSIGKEIRASGAGTATRHDSGTIPGNAYSATN